MKIKKILLFAKQSTYKSFFVDDNVTHGRKINAILKADRKRVELSHQMHYTTIEKIKIMLRQQEVDFVSSVRGHNQDLSKFDLIITLGGDGTFLEAARELKSGLLLGVNSAPVFSVGRFCTVTVENFSRVLKKITNNTYKVKELQRLQLNLNGDKKDILSLNEILVSHTNPAYLCRYHLKVGERQEEQRSSGMWIATAAGSSAAISSAGGKVLRPSDKRYQFFVREPYQGLHTKYKLTQAILNHRSKITVTSLMRKGTIYVDGPHFHFPFDYGSILEVKSSNNPIKTITL